MNRIAGAAVAASVVGAFGLGAWLYFEGYLGGPPADGTLPVVQPLPEPTRQKPDEPGGYSAEHLETMLLDGADGEQDAGAELLLPGYEEPITRPRPEALDPESESAAPDVVLEDGDDTATDEPVVQEDPPRLPERRHPYSAWKASIQLLAVRSPRRAILEAHRLIAAHPDVFDGLDFRIREFPVSEDEKVQRLQAGPFESRKAAGAVCDRLEQRGISCFVAKGQ